MKRSDIVKAARAAILNSTMTALQRHNVSYAIEKVSRHKVVGSSHDAARDKARKSIAEEIDNQLRQLEVRYGYEENSWSRTRGSSYTEEGANKVEKVEKAKKIKKNGIKRPGPASITGQIWKITDDLARKLKRPPLRKEVLPITSEAGFNPNTSATQYGLWRRFYGLKGTGVIK